VESPKTLTKVSHLTRRKKDKNAWNIIKSFSFAIGALFSQFSSREKKEARIYLIYVCVCFKRLKFVNRVATAEI